MNLSFENSTRIRYTLPGYVPELTRSPEEEAEQDVGAGFQSRIRALQQHDPITWKQTLSLDRAAFGPTHFAPPAKPISLDVPDTASERLRWYQILAAPPMDASSEVLNMFSLLRKAQQDAEVVMTQTASAAGV